MLVGGFIDEERGHEPKNAIPEAGKGKKTESPLEHGFADTLT